VLRGARESQLKINCFKVFHRNERRQAASLESGSGYTKRVRAKADVDTWNLKNAEESKGMSAAYTDITAGQVRW